MTCSAIRTLEASTWQAGQPQPVVSVTICVTPTAQAYVEQVVSVPTPWEGWCQQEMQGDCI